MNKDITIARRFNNLLEAVTELNIDLSYNKQLALSDIKALDYDRDLTVTAVFADTNGQLWYILRSVRENLNLLHKYVPFHSCISNAPFEVYEPTYRGSRSSLEEADTLAHFTQIAKCDGARKIIAIENLIAG